jgi:hypothetical protein
VPALRRRGAARVTAGEADTLLAGEFTLTVRQGVLRWFVTIADRRGAVMVLSAGTRERAIKSAHASLRGLARKPEHLRRRSIRPLIEVGAPPLLPRSFLAKNSRGRRGSGPL